MPGGNLSPRVEPGLVRVQAGTTCFPWPQFCCKIEGLGLWLLPALTYRILGLLVLMDHWLSSASSGIPVSSKDVLSHKESAFNFSNTSM